MLASEYMNQVNIQPQSTQLRFGLGSLNALSHHELLAPYAHASIIASPLAEMQHLGYLDSVVHMLEGRGMSTRIIDENSDELSDVELLVALGDQGCEEIMEECLSHGGSHCLVRIPAYGSGEDCASLNDGCFLEIQEDWEASVQLTHPSHIPHLCIIDPSLSVELSARLTAQYAMSDMVQAVEAYLSTEQNPLCEVYAIKSLSLLAKYLPRLVKDSASKKARNKVALAQQLARIAVQSAGHTSLQALVLTLHAAFPQLSQEGLRLALAPSYFRSLTDVTPKRLMKLGFTLTGRAAKHPEDFIDALVELKKRCHIQKGSSLLKMGVKLSSEQREQICQCARERLSALFLHDSRRLSHGDMQDILESS